MGGTYYKLRLITLYDKVNELVQFGQNFDFKIRRDHEKFNLSTAPMSR